MLMMFLRKIFLLLVQVQHNTIEYVGKAKRLLNGHRK